MIGRSSCMARQSPLCNAVTFLADRDFNRAFEHPDLLVDTHVTATGIESHALAGRKMHFDNLHRLRHAWRRNVAAHVARSRVFPLWLIVAAGYWTFGCL